MFINITHKHQLKEGTRNQSDLNSPAEEVPLIMKALMSASLNLPVTHSLKTETILDNPLK